MDVSEPFFVKFDLIMSLTQELSDRCRIILHKCDEFGSDDLMRAVFITTELEPYKNSLPQCNSVDERVKRTISYLLPKRLAGNLPVFPFFIAELRNHRDPADNLHNELGKLYEHVVQSLKDKIVVPFVVAAMTSNEADALVKETIFEDISVAPIDRNLYHDFKASLDVSDVGDLQICYGETPETWKPLVSSEDTIEEIIDKTLDYINLNHRVPKNLPLLYPLFLTEDFFTQDMNVRRKLLQLLERIRRGLNYGCCFNVSSAAIPECCKF